MKVLKYGLVLLLFAVGFGFYLYNKPHKNMEKASADLTMSATALFQSYEQDETTADAEYLDKIVAISGKIKDVSKDDEGNTSLTLEAGNEMFGVICKLDELSKKPQRSFTIGETVNLKGICTGMLMDVVLVRCVEI